MESSGYKSLEQVKEVLSWKFDVEKEKKAIEDFNQELFAVENRLSSINKEIGEKHYKEEEHQQLFVQIKELNAKIKQLNEETGTIRNRLEELSMKIEKRETLKKELNEVLIREEDLKTLKNMFKGSGFVNYVSSVHLQNLCNAANERFYKLTGQKLSLEITADNNFRVRDFMNGGKVRSVKTLSGGQTFQAALSLALALADNIQDKEHEGQNFFFLDEGFGTLDKESLDVVFETLKCLRKEQRIVGVISHVEEMQQEIETYLQVTNDEERGSLVVPSWKI
jgi:exonuclease SbcC